MTTTPQTPPQSHPGSDLARPATPRRVPPQERIAGRLKPVPQPRPAQPREPVMRAVPASAAGNASAVGEAVCPFCAGPRSRLRQERCPRCGLADTPGTRQPTAQRLGPWFLYQSRNPAAPGMSWVTLRELVDAGKLTADSVVRGPTTGQMWVKATRCRGVSRLLGWCWACGQRTGSRADRCESCEADQRPPEHADVWLDPESSPMPRAARVPQAWLAAAVRDEPAAESAPPRRWLGKAALAAAAVALITTAAAAAVAPQRTLDTLGQGVEGARGLWHSAVTMLREPA